MTGAEPTAVADPDAVALTLFAGAGQADPYPWYARLRELAPVHRTSLGIWLVSRFDDGETVLRSPAAAKALDVGRETPFRPGTERWPEHPALRVSYGSMFMADPPDHTRLRASVIRAFTARRIAALQPFVEQAIAAKLEEMAARAVDGVLDVVDVLAFPLPVAVIGELVGVPEPEQAVFRELVLDLTSVGELVYSEDDLARADAAAVRLDAYFRDLIELRRRQPADDLVSVLAGPGGGLGDSELVLMLILLFVAGFETTTNLIGNGLLALMGAPDQLDRLRDEPDLAAPAVEELLRFDAPAQYMPRQLREPVTLGDQVLPAGASLLVLLGAANRDPARFPDPDRLDLGRSQGASLAFGSGIHYCLGAALARMEGRLLFPALLRRFPRLRPAGPPDRRPGLFLRGLTRLPVTLDGT